MSIIQNLRREDLRLFSVAHRVCQKQLSFEQDKSKDMSVSMTRDYIDAYSALCTIQYFFLSSYFAPGYSGSIRPFKGY